MTCKRCGVETPRLTLTQRYDPQCAREVQRLVEQDTARRTRFPFAKDLTVAAA